MDTDFSARHNNAVSFWKQQDAMASGSRPKSTSAGPTTTATTTQDPKLSNSKRSSKMSFGSVFKSSSRRDKRDGKEEKDKPQEKDKKKQEKTPTTQPKNSSQPKEKSDLSRISNMLSPKTKRKKDDSLKSSSVEAIPSHKKKASDPKIETTNSSPKPSKDSPSGSLWSKRSTQSAKTSEIKSSKPSTKSSKQSTKIDPIDNFDDVMVSSPIPNSPTSKPMESSTALLQPEPLKKSTSLQNSTSLTSDEPLSLIAPPSNTPQKPKFLSKDQRENVVYEIHETEETYVQDLKCIVEVFLLPLRESKIISPEEISKIFSTVELLLPLHQDFLKQISEAESVVKLISPGKRPTTTVGQCFMTMSQYLKMYSQYCSNQQTANTTVEQLKKNNSEFEDFLYTAQSNPMCRSLDLLAFLIKPMQRVCKYPLLLRELLKNTPEYHCDYKAISKALEMISATVSVINDSKKILEESNALLEIQSMIIYPRHLSPNDYPIVAPGRKFRDRGKCFMVTNDFKQHSVKWLLFNDIFVITSTRHKLKQYVPFSSALIGHVKLDGVDFAFEIIHCGKDKIWLGFKEEDTRDNMKKLLISCGMIDRSLEGPIESLLQNYTHRPIPIPSEKYQSQQPKPFNASGNTSTFQSKPLPSVPPQRNRGATIGASAMGRGGNSIKPFPSSPGKQLPPVSKALPQAPGKFS